MNKSYEILYSLILRNTFNPGQDKNLGPGKLIEKLSSEKRAILSQLKSSDLQNLRTDTIWGTKKGKGRWGTRR
jgi:hypothetical protein